MSGCSLNLAQRLNTSQIRVQGVPRNMTVARRFESRLRALNLYIQSPLPTFFHMYDSLKNNNKILLAQ